MKLSLLHKLSILVGFLLGARVFTAVLLIFALYVSIFFLFNQEENINNFIYDYKIHAIVFCSFMSILAGGIINQFYDIEKDKITSPVRNKIQNFIAKKYFLYTYVSLNILSLGISFFLSKRVIFFFLIYQFFMWFYSHKLSKILILNNLTFVGLSIYPFFGMLIYYQIYSFYTFLISVFLFLILLIIDIIKDVLTTNVDRIFGYHTIANVFGINITKIVSIFLTLLNISISIMIIDLKDVHFLMSQYFFIGVFVQALVIFLLTNKAKFYSFLSLNILRIWVFIGILYILVDGLVTHS